jgi:hypothetical protein
LFTIAWCALGFVVLRALVELWLHDRRIAAWTALAVTGAFALGAFSPFALRSLSADSPAPAPAIVAVPAPAVTPTPVATTAARAAPGKPATCRPGASPAASTARGHLDTVTSGDAQTTLADDAALPANATVRFSGWILTGAGPGRAACMLVDGVIPESTGSYGAERPDVAAALQDANALRSGFTATVVLSPGAHRLSVGTLDDRGALLALPAAVAVTAR